MRGEAEKEGPLNKLTLLSTLTLLIVATPLSAEEVKLTTIIPAQDVLRVKKGVIGDTWSNSATVPDTSISTSGLAVEGSIHIGVSNSIEAYNTSLFVLNNSDGGYGIKSEVTGPNNTFGIYGRGGNWGVYGETGVDGTGIGTGVMGSTRSPSGVGLAGYAPSGGKALKITGASSLMGPTSITDMPITGDAGTLTIGGTDPQGHKLYVYGDAYKTVGGDHWNSASDARLKKNINSLNGALDKMLKLRGVSYQWKEPKKHGDMNGVYIGFIAQEVEKIFPEWVTTGKDGYKNLGSIGFDALTVEAIRELKQEMNDLKAENSELKSKVLALEAKKAKIARGQ